MQIEKELPVIPPLKRPGSVNSTSIIEILPPNELKRQRLETSTEEKERSVQNGFSHSGFDQNVELLVTSFCPRLLQLKHSNLRHQWNDVEHGWMFELIPMICDLETEIGFDQLIDVTSKMRGVLVSKSSFWAADVISGVDSVLLEMVRKTRTVLLNAIEEAEAASAVKKASGLVSQSVTNFLIFQTRIVLSHCFFSLFGYICAKKGLVNVDNHLSTIKTFLQGGELLPGKAEQNGGMTTIKYCTLLETIQYHLSSDGSMFPMKTPSKSAPENVTNIKAFATGAIIFFEEYLNQKSTEPDETKPRKSINSVFEENGGGKRTLAVIDRMQCLQDDNKLAPFKTLKWSSDHSFLPKSNPEAFAKVCRKDMPQKQLTTFDYAMKKPDWLSDGDDSDDERPMKPRKVVA